jgi:HEAT repeat protein
MLTWSIFVATTISGQFLSATDPVTPPPTPRVAEDSSSAREILTRFQEHRQQSTTGPLVKHNLKLEMECLVKLMRIGSAAVPVLVDCLKDKEEPPSTRALAAHALGFLADDRTRPVLLQAIEDKDGFVQAYSRKALGRLGRLQETPKLREVAGKDPTRSAYIDMMFVLTRDDEPNPEPIRQALRNYDLARMDGARLGKPAPDFTLADASGKTWHLGQFRGKQAVVLIFLVGTN